MDIELKKIKKKYGEEMMKYCKENFSTILETPYLLLETLLKSFAPNRSLYQDLKRSDLLVDFKNHIYSVLRDTTTVIKQNISLTPKEMFESIGYDFYECKTEEDIQKFRKYYAQGEELCTFKGNRLKSNYVFFVVRKDVDKIKREDFITPRRQDKYGTSVMSIQFTKDSSHTLSIKNRYNHKVQNPDATYSNDLENIIAGLTESFENTYGLVQQNKGGNLDIEKYVRANNGKYYKYNYEIDNVYYCTNNTVIYDFKAREYEREKFIVFDYFILNIAQKQIVSLADDGFIKAIGKIKNINIKKNPLMNEKTIIITNEFDEEFEITLDSENNIIKLKSSVKKVPNQFMQYNEKTKKVQMDEACEIGDLFYFFNTDLEELILPEVKSIGSNSLSVNDSLLKLYVPNVVKIGDEFLCNNIQKLDLYAPKLRDTGSRVLNYNKDLIIDIKIKNAIRRCEEREEERLVRI